jgi:hypothetical protein
LDLENSLPIALGSIACTSIFSFVLWSGYTIGFLHLVYVIAGLAVTILGFLLVKRGILPMFLFALWILALFLWGMFRLGNFMIYILVSVLVLGFMIYSIIS